MKPVCKGRGPQSRLQGHPPRLWIRTRHSLLPHQHNGNHHGRKQHHMAPPPHPPKYQQHIPTTHPLRSSTPARQLPLRRTPTSYWPMARNPLQQTRPYLLNTHPHCRLHRPHSHWSEYAIKMACTRKVTHILEIVVGDLITIKYEFLGSRYQPLTH
jgi:hypothetical protein